MENNNSMLQLNDSLDQLRRSNNWGNAVISSEIGNLRKGLIGSTELIYSSFNQLSVAHENEIFAIQNFSSNVKDSVEKASRSIEQAISLSSARLQCALENVQSSIDISNELLKKVLVAEEIQTSLLEEINRGIQEPYIREINNGIEDFGLQNYKAAEKSFIRALNIRESLFLAHFYLGQIYCATGSESKELVDLGKSEYHFNQAIFYGSKLFSKNEQIIDYVVLSYRFLADIYYQDKRYQDALAALENGIKISNNTFLTKKSYVSQYARCFLKSGNKEKALEYTQYGLSIDSTFLDLVCDPELVDIRDEIIKQIDNQVKIMKKTVSNSVEDIDDYELLKSINENFSSEDMHSYLGLMKVKELLKNAQEDSDFDELKMYTELEAFFSKLHGENSEKALEYHLMYIETLFDEDENKAQAIELMMEHISTLLSIDKEVQGEINELIDWFNEGQFEFIEQRVAFSHLIEKLGICFQDVLEDEHLQIAKCYFERSNKSYFNEEIENSGISWIETLCKKNNKEAEFMMAKCLQNGFSVNQNIPKAIDIYEKLSDEGCFKASHELARIYLTDSFLDYQKVFHYSQIGSESGYASSKYILGCCYYSGWGVDKDRERAISLLKEASSQGVVVATYNLAGFYDGEESLRLYRKAAEEGYLPAIRKLREYYNRYDFLKCLPWSFQAALKGNAEDKGFLAKQINSVGDSRFEEISDELLVTIDVLKRNIQKIRDDGCYEFSTANARYWYEEALKDGNVDIIPEYANFMRRNFLDDCSIEFFKSLYEKSIQVGNIESHVSFGVAILLKEIRKKEYKEFAGPKTVPEPLLQEAMNHFEKASEKGSKNGKYCLAVCLHFNGKGFKNERLVSKLLKESGKEDIRFSPYDDFIRYIAMNFGRY